MRRRCICGDDVEVLDDLAELETAEVLLLLHVIHQLDELQRKVQQMSDQEQQDADALGARIDADVATLGTEIKAEIDAAVAAAEAANPGVDLSGITAAVANLDQLTTDNAPPS